MSIKQRLRCSWLLGHWFGGRQKGYGDRCIWCRLGFR